LAQQLVTDVVLVRPLLAISPAKQREPWHFELPNAAPFAVSIGHQPIVEERPSLFAELGKWLPEAKGVASVSIERPGTCLANA
jgi:hypothetical protein